MMKAEIRVIAATSQQMPSSASNHQMLGKRYRIDSPSKPPESINLSNTWISHLKLPDCEILNFVVLSHSVYVILLQQLQETNIIAKRKWGGYCNGQQSQSSKQNSLTVIISVDQLITVSLEKKQMRSLLNSQLIQTSRIDISVVHKSNLNPPKIIALQSILTFKPVHHPRIFLTKKRLGLFEKTECCDASPQIHTVDLLLGLPK